MGVAGLTQRLQLEVQNALMLLQQCKGLGEANAESLCTYVCGNAISMLVALYVCRVHNSSACVWTRNVFPIAFHKVKCATSWQLRWPKPLTLLPNYWFSRSFNVQYGVCLFLIVTGDVRMRVCLVDILQ